MNATVLVTGGNGFVGSHCIVELLRQGFQVRATLRDAYRLSKVLSERAAWDFACLRAAGQRFIAAGDFLWFADMARMLKSEFGDRAAKVPTRIMPDPVMRLLSLFHKPLRAITPGLGRRHVFNSDKARRMLEFAPRPPTQTIVDCARSLLAEPQH
jgi:nucleoside-diphosphate-sugar epimerase